MDILRILFIPVLLLSVPPSTCATSFPDRFGEDPVLTRAGQPQIWSADTMYEHINGEAELLKRYGVRSLSYAIYEGQGETRLAVDLFDMGSAVNAFGLFRLYAGCDGREYDAHGATVLAGEFTSYARRGKYFMRIDVEAHDAEGPVRNFLSAIGSLQPEPEPLPVTAERLLVLMSDPCSLSYHPEDVDYDLSAGPGYTWTGPDGVTYFLRVLGSHGDAETLAVTLTGRGAPTVLVWGNCVAWPRVRTDETTGYLKGVLRKVVKW